VGGALGVAIVGSVMSSIYLNRVDKATAALNVPAAARAQIEDSVGGAVQVAAKLPGAAGKQLADVAKDAFMTGMHRGVLVAAGAAFVGSIVAWVWLPAHGTEHESSFAPGAGDAVDEQAASEPALAPMP
jgi:DHA2 family multidrug resistance protein-like MFS transporter